MTRFALTFILTTILCSHAAFAGEVTLSGRISPASVSTLISEIKTLHRKGDRNITVTLRSDGGELEPAFRAYDEIRRYGARTSVSDDCASACTVIYAAGRERLASPRARFLFHPVEFQTIVFEETAESRAMDPRELERLRAPIREEYRRNRRRLEAEFAERWLNHVRTASPRLAQRLDRSKILVRGSELWIDARHAQRVGYVTDFKSEHRL